MGSKVRYVVTGQLILESASHFGQGTQGESVDMLLLRDVVSGQPFIPGSSIAGALRSYAQDYSCGYRSYGGEDPGVVTLFGHVTDENATISSLAVFDSYATQTSSEIRDSVRVDPKTGRAADHALFQAEVLPRETVFGLHMELDVHDPDDEADLVGWLICLLEGLERGQVPLGAKKSRGFGKCKARCWRVKRFSLTDKAGWQQWLALSSRKGGPVLGGKSYEHIGDVFSDCMPGLEVKLPEDRRHRAVIGLDLQLEAGVLVGSPGLGMDSADVAHIWSGGVPVLPGTSLAGVLRARALRIAKVVRKERNDAARWVAEIFGSEAKADSGDSSAAPVIPDRQSPEESLESSMLFVEEGVFQGGTTLQVNRIKVDRFTGGVMENHLFDEEPLYRASLRTSLELRMPYFEKEDKSMAKLGLLLLCVKDLLDGDLPVGGTSSVGRGYFEGGKALVRWQSNGEIQDYCIASGETCNPDAARFFNEAVAQFCRADSISDKEGE